MQVVTLKAGPEGRGRTRRHPRRKSTPPQQREATCHTVEPRLYFELREEISMRGEVVMSGSSHTGGSNAETTDRVFFGLPDVYVDKGAHVAHFFQGDQERVNILAPFLRAGLECGDQCVLVAEASASPIIADSLKELGVDVEAALASGQLLVSDGGSSMDEMSSMFEDVISRSKSAGREVIRIGGDMTWALGKLPTAEKLLEWEAFYDKYVGPRANLVAL